MSWYVMAWAEHASVANVYERALLTLMAHRSEDDGTRVYVSVETMAEYCMCNERTIQRTLRAFEERGVIVEGDQRHVAHLPADRRPVVYDLMVPAESYPADGLRKINQERIKNNLPPLTPQNRPPLPDAEASRKPRKDVGAKRPKKAVTGTDDSGLQVTPSPGDPGLQVTDGVTTSPERDDYESPNSFPLTPPFDSSEGGYVTGERHQHESTRDEAPPPEKIQVELNDRSTWHCRYHLDRPELRGAPCTECKHVRLDCEAELERRRVEEQKRAAALKQEQVEEERRRRLEQIRADEERRRRAAEEMGPGRAACLDGSWKKRKRGGDGR